MKLKHWLMIPLSLGGVLMLFVIDRYLDVLVPFSVYGQPGLDRQLRGQIARFVWATLFVGLTYLLYRENFRTFFRLGDLDAPAEPVRWLISEGENWRKVGRTWAVILTLGTTAFLIIGIVMGSEIFPGNLRHLWMALPFAAANAYTEEMITRFAVVTALWKRLPNRTIYMISALVFGIPHYFGIPGGPIGVLMAGFLGWLMAKSVVETKGVFWAWFLHFIQDVVIFTALVLTLTP